VLELAIKCRFETAKPFQDYVQYTIRQIRDRIKQRGRACDQHDREIRELKQQVDELTDENYRLKEILEAVRKSIEASTK
jgi:predicted RNase H-like nuclease (RuvC/YqgF family)